MKGAVWMALVIFLSGCLMGPDYVPPDPCIPETWNSDPCCAGTPSSSWWEDFHDPFLNRYIEAAATCNQDLLVAEATIYQARALRRITASELFPQVNGNLSASRTYFSKNGPVFAIGMDETATTPGLPFQVQVPQIQNIYTALVDISWEIDLFGRIRRSVESAEANIGSAMEQRNGVLVSLFAEVARNYFDLRSAQKKGGLIEENLALLEQEAGLVRNRWEKGLENRLAVENVEAQLAELRASLPPILAEIYRAIYTLSVLTGNLPEALVEELLPTYPLPAPPENIACGLRSDLLRRRPDIRQAERELAAATANIGVAVASFFPSLNLSADIGLQSILLRNFFEGRSLTWSLGGTGTVPIFQGGNLVGNLRLSEGQAAAAAYTYQQTVLNALSETESALMAYREDEKMTFEWHEAVQRYRNLDELTGERYRKGLVSLSDLIDSGRTVNLYEQNLLEREATLLQDLVSLYKALGGGWEMTQEVI